MTNKMISIGNITTIINTISLMVAGLIFGTLSAYELHLPIDVYGLSAIIGFIIATVFGYINAKYHNTFWDKEEDKIILPVDLSDAQIQAIQNFIQHQTGETIEIESIDPSLEYEEY